MNLKKEALEWLKAFLYALVAATIVRLYIFETMLVPTGSMIPTIQVGDRLFVEKITYTVRKPIPGEIVVFWSPFVDERASKMLGLFDKFMDLFAPKKFRGHVKYVKRLIGKSGDVISIGEDGRVRVNGVVPDALRNIVYEPEGIFKYEKFYEWLYTASKLRSNKAEYRKFLLDLAQKHGRSVAILIFSLVGEEDLQYGEPFLPGLLNYFDPSIVYYDEKKGKYHIPGMIYHDFYEEYYSGLDLSKYIIKEEGKIVLIVPDGFFFFMGDNTKESLDSRFFGFVPEDHVIGWPILRVWPLNRFGPLDHLKLPVF